jgi:hypothetical protein
MKHLYQFNDFINENQTEFKFKNDDNEEKLKKLFGISLRDLDWIFIHVCDQLEYPKLEITIHDYNKSSIFEDDKYFIVGITNSWESKFDYNILLDNIGYINDRLEDFDLKAIMTSQRDNDNMVFQINLFISTYDIAEKHYNYGPKFDIY